MAIKVRNIQTNEIINVLNVVVENGTIVSEARRPNKGTRFYNSYPMMLALGKTEDGRDTHCLRDGWVLNTTRKPRTKKIAEPITPKAEPTTIEPTAPINEPAPTIEPTTEPIATEPTSEPEQNVEEFAKKIEQVEGENPIEGYSIEIKCGVDAENLKEELSNKYGSMGADIFDAAKKLAFAIRPEAVVNKNYVEKIVEERMQEWAENGRKNTIIEVVTPRGRNKVNGSVCENFDIYCNVVEAGEPLYMYGPAGSGKSYTAKQIADALGFDYYETSQAMFAHELKGYGDAKGEFVPTAFYRAFSGGGVFFLDEVDASAPEALVVLNNAIANKRFDFPVIGNIEAHKDFRVIAAGNTRMTGATMEYTARQMQDTSFKNRFLFEVVTYARDVFMQVCNNDKEIVDFGEDLRRSARETGISQLFSYRQGDKLANLQAAYKNDDAHLLRSVVLQEKEIDDTTNLYEHLKNKGNRWAKAMKQCIERMRNEEVW